MGRWECAWLCVSCVMLRETGYGLGGRIRVVFTDFLLYYFDNLILLHCFDNLLNKYISYYRRAATAPSNIRKLITECWKCGFSKEECSSLKMILGSKHVGAILNVLVQKFYVCALVGVLIKWLYETHGATIKIKHLCFLKTNYQK